MTRGRPFQVGKILGEGGGGVGRPYGARVSLAMPLGDSYRCYQTCSTKAN